MLANTLERYLNLEYLAMKVGSGGGGGGGGGGRIHYHNYGATPCHLH